MLGRQPKSSSKSELEADFLLNKHVFRTAAYTFAGFGLGLGASLLFFKNKAAMTAVCAGAGAGYGIAGFGSEWSNYKRFKSWMRNQTQQARQGIDYNQYQSQMSQQKSQQQRDEHKSSQQDQQKDQHKDEHKNERKTYQSKADNQGQEKSHQQRDEHKSSQKEKPKDEGKTYQSKADNHGQEKSHHQRDEQKSSRQDQQKDQYKDEHKNERKTYQSKADNQGQQRHEQQQKQQHVREAPMNPEAKHKQDIAEEGRTLEREPGRVDTKMGQGRNFYTSTQDKKKREEEAVYSQSMQGDKAGEDEVQRGEKGPQNTQIPPSQRDWTGGHANKGVLQQQVHRGTPESDKMGKSVRPDKEPNTNPDKGVPKQENQALSGIDLKGQKLQTFQSNPLPLGKAGQTHEIQKTYQEGRNRATDPNLDNVKRTVHGMEQDRMGQSIKEGIIHKVRERSPTEAGVGNYRPDVAEQGTKNQVNAVLE